MSGKGIKRSNNSRVDSLSQKKYRNSNQDEKTRKKSLPIHVKHSRRLVTPGATKLSHEYEEFVTNTTASTKQRDHHQDSDSDNDNKKVPPFYPPIQGRSDDSPVTDNPKTKIMELHLDNGDDFKYISQFRFSRETVIDQKYHYPLLFYVQQLHNKIALLERKFP